jgi:hypothetical protein
LAKPPPADRPVAIPRGSSNQIARNFPVLTPQSYLPPNAFNGGVYSSVREGTGGIRPFPILTPNSYLPSGGTLEPPIMNYSNGPSILPASASFPSMAPSMMPSAGSYPQPMPHRNQGTFPMLGPSTMFHEPAFQSHSHRRPRRLCRPRRSRRCRPVIHVIDSSSCSSISSCRSLSSCSRRRSRSHSRRHPSTPQPQQPIILLPIQCQQSSNAALPPPTINQQTQPQQIFLPPIQMQQPGNIQQQALNLPPIQFQTLPGQGQIQGGQQQQLTLAPIQLNSSNLTPNTSSNPIIITSGPSLTQSSSSMPQITNLMQPQQLQNGQIQYVQNMAQTSSPLQYVTSERRSNIAPSHVLVNSTNEKRSNSSKTVQRSLSARHVTQMDLKYGRRPFDWYKNKQKDNVIKENVRIQQT